MTASSNARSNAQSNAVVAMHGRTDGRTNADPLSPTRANPPSVTRTRTYEISPSPWTDRAASDYQTQLRNLRDVARKAKTR